MGWPHSTDQPRVTSCAHMSDHLRELDKRSRDGIDVLLLWRERDDRAVVTVADAKTGERFSIEVPDGEPG
jgi:hypothetical protein